MPVSHHRRNLSGSASLAQSYHTSIRLLLLGAPSSGKTTFLKHCTGTKKHPTAATTCCPRRNPTPPPPATWSGTGTGTTRVTSAPRGDPPPPAPASVTAMTMTTNTTNTTATTTMMMRNPAVKTTKHRRFASTGVVPGNSTQIRAAGRRRRRRTTTTTSSSTSGMVAASTGSSLTGMVTTEEIHTAAAAGHHSLSLSVSGSSSGPDEEEFPALVAGDQYFNQTNTTNTVTPPPEKELTAASQVTTVIMTADTAIDSSQNQTSTLVPKATVKNSASTNSILSAHSYSSSGLSTGSIVVKHISKNDPILTQVSLFSALTVKCDDLEIPEDSIYDFRTKQQDDDLHIHQQHQQPQQPQQHHTHQQLQLQPLQQLQQKQLQKQLPEQNHPFQLDHEEIDYFSLEASSETDGLDHGEDSDHDQDLDQDPDIPKDLHPTLHPPHPYLPSLHPDFVPITLSVPLNASHKQQLQCKDAHATQIPGGDFVDTFCQVWDVPWRWRNSVQKAFRCTCSQSATNKENLASTLPSDNRDAKNSLRSFSKTKLERWCHTRSKSIDVATSLLHMSMGSNSLAASIGTPIQYSTSRTHPLQFNNVWDEEEQVEQWVKCAICDVATCIILVIDVSSKVSFNMIYNWFTQQLAAEQDSLATKPWFQKAPIMIMLSKADTPEDIWQVTHDDIASLMSLLNLASDSQHESLIYTSACSDLNVETCLHLAASRCIDSLWGKSSTHALAKPQQDNDNWWAWLMDDNSSPLDPNTISNMGVTDPTSTTTTGKLGIVSTKPPRPDKSQVTSTTRQKQYTQAEENFESFAYLEQQLDSIQANIQAVGSSIFSEFDMGYKDLEKELTDVASNWFSGWNSEPQTPPSKPSTETPTNGTTSFLYSALNDIF